MITEKNKQRLRELRNYVKDDVAFSFDSGYFLDTVFCNFYISNSVYSVELNTDGVFTVGFEDGANPDINPFINDFCNKLEKHSEELDKIVQKKKKEKIEEANNILNKYN